jgi:hypothetical protein
VGNANRGMDRLILRAAVGNVKGQGDPDVASTTATRHQSANPTHVSNLPGRSH